MRWLAHRGGALDFRDFCLANPGQPYPVAVALGADPATILGAVTPVPDTLVRIPVRRAAARRAHRDRQMPRAASLQVPASAEIVLEGISSDDHPRRDSAGRPVTATTPATTTSRRLFPVFTIERITMRRDPIYHSTYTGKPPDEPADARRRAERSVRAAAAKAVPRDRRLLPAARRLHLPDGGGAA